MTRFTSLVRTMVLAVVVAGVLAAEAQGACVASSARQQAEVAQVVFTGVVESGPITPAVMRVEHWQKGSGPATVEVDTGIYEDMAFGEGISPQPGERWRIYGDFYEGRVVTGACAGSRRIESLAAAPWLRAGTTKAQLVPATVGGRALAAPLPRIRVVRGKPTRLRLPATVRGLWLVGAPPKARASRRAGRWSVALPRSARWGGRIVVDTGDGFYAARLVTRRAS